MRFLIVSIVLALSMSAANAADVVRREQSPAVTYHVGDPIYWRYGQGADA